MKPHDILSLAVPLVGFFLLFSIVRAESEDKPAAAVQWDRYVHDFIESYFTAHPDAAVSAGRHEFDGKLPDWSRAGLDREVLRLREERVHALSFKPADLDERRRFERDYLIAVIDGKLFWLTSAGWPYRNPVFYERSLDPNVYLTREYAPLPKRMRAYIRYAKRNTAGGTADPRESAVAASPALPRHRAHYLRRVGVVL